MTLIEGLLKDALVLDAESEPELEEDMVFLTYPCRFPTVTFHLISTRELSAIADRIRMGNGLKPMYPVDGIPESGCDHEGWYSFTASIYSFDDSHTRCCIEFMVENSESPDNGFSDCIDVSGEEQAVLERLDEQCRRHFSRSCMDLLREAEGLMEDKS